MTKIRIVEGESIRLPEFTRDDNTSELISHDDMSRLIQSGSEIIGRFRRGEMSVLDLAIELSSFYDKLFSNRHKSIAIPLTEDGVILSVDESGCLEQNHNNYLIWDSLVRDHVHIIGADPKQYNGQVTFFYGSVDGRQPSVFPVYESNLFESLLDHIENVGVEQATEDLLSLYRTVDEAYLSQIGGMEAVAPLAKPIFEK